MSHDRPDRRLSPGLYESPVTAGVAEALENLAAGLAQRRPMKTSGESLLLATHLFHRLVHALESLPARDRLAHQIDLTNRILASIEHWAPESGADPRDQISDPGELLTAILADPRGRMAAPVAPIRPHIPLSTSDLITNARSDVSIGPEIKRELASADRVDLLCSFVKWTGLRVIEEELRAFLERCPGGLRVLTTTYVGATERRALDLLANLGAQVRVSYDTSQTRLHAKAWLIHRDSGFSTAYIGSSNLSGQAMLDGLEWNVRLSHVDNRGILERFQTAFEQYWADSEFQAYDPARDADRFDRAIRVERGRSDPGSNAALLASIEVTARPHQQEILDELAAERARGHMRNLVVAATGTGKTVVAALDYERIAAEVAEHEHGSPLPTLLFVAHREEILQQSHETFRLVLRRPGFGERLGGGTSPTEGKHVFASIQSLNRERLDRLDPAAYEIVIVDEFHHAAAASYQQLIGHLRPKILLGLTATPERTDGQSILHHFDDRIASEMRLWKALDQGLLAPFQYFGLRGPDVSGVEWKRGRYAAAELRQVYTAQDWFVRQILSQVAHKVTDVRRMRALGFCVDIEHAKFMSERFNRAGIEAAAVWGQTPERERARALADLRDGRIQVLFSVDLFNEGVDLPSVDTILFLRPTESATLFLQQLGRGLRRQDGKTCCTVLDFIGSAHRRFRFDERYRAIVGGTRRHIERQVEQGFPSLPSGCSIVLDRASREAVLANLRDQLGRGRAGLVADLRALGPDADLPTFLKETGFELEDVYGTAGDSFGSLRERAGFGEPLGSDDARTIRRAYWRLLHLDRAGDLDRFLMFLRGTQPPVADPSDPTQRMLFVLLGFMRKSLDEMTRLWRTLWSSDPLRTELIQLFMLLLDRSRRLTRPLPGRLAPLPLAVHGTYSQDEVLAALDVRSRKGGVLRIQSGVYHCRKQRCDLFFVTIEKDESDYSPTTMYKDYPLSPDRFHWETQSACHSGTSTGARYLGIAPGTPDQALLFVRQRKQGDRGETLPYLLLGPVYHRAHREERPIQIEWDLHFAMPAREYQDLKLAAG